MKYISNWDCDDSKIFSKLLKLKEIDNTIEENILTVEDLISKLTYNHLNYPENAKDILIKENPKRYCKIYEGLYGGYCVNHINIYCIELL